MLISVTNLGVQIVTPNNDKNGLQHRSWVPMSLTKDPVMLHFECNSHPVWDWLEQFAKKLGLFHLSCVSGRRLVSVDMNANETQWSFVEKHT